MSGLYALVCTYFGLYALIWTPLGLCVRSSELLLLELDFPIFFRRLELFPRQFELLRPLVLVALFELLWPSHALV